MLHAIVDSIVFTVAKLIEVYKHESGKNLAHVVVDGGVSKNNYILQTIANLTGTEF